MSNLKNALFYHSAGLNVVPCESGRWEKKPADAPKDWVPKKALTFFVKWREYEKKRATVEEVEKWWTDWPDADIAIITGKISGVTVIDTEAGADLSFFGLNGSNTVSAASGGGGRHFYFAYTDQVINSVRFAPLYDIRNDGGIIIAPPSKHPSGGEYRWLNGIGMAELLPFPQSVVTAFQAKSGKSSVNWQDRLTKEIPQGERNQTATSVAGKLFVRFRPDEWEGQAWPLLVAWNEKVAKPPLSQQELRSVFDSIRGSELRRKESMSDIGEPTVTKEGRALVVSVPVKNGRAVFSFHDPTSGTDDVAAVVKSRVEFPDVPAHTFSVKLKLMSGSSRSDYARNLKAAFGKDVNWELVLSSACDVFLTAFDVDALSDIRTVDKVTPQETSFLLEPFIELGSPNLLYAMGGVGKSYLAARMMASIINCSPMFGAYPLGKAKILYLDYENSFSAIRRRMDSLETYCEGYKRENLSSLYCLEATKPLHDIKDRLRDYVAQNGIGLIVVDPIQTALGGSAIDDDVAARYANALREIGITSLSIAHIAKGSTGDTAYGSVFFHNLCRNAWFLDGDAEEDSDVKHLVLSHKKHNNTRRHSQIAYRMTTDPMGTRFEIEDITVSAPEKASLPRRLAKLLKERWWSVQEICDRIPDVDKKTIKQSLWRMKGHGDAAHDEENERWRSTEV